MAPKKKKQKPDNDEFVRPDTAPASVGTETTSPNKEVLSDERAVTYRKWMDAAIRWQEQKFLPNAKKQRRAYSTGRDVAFGGGRELTHSITVPIILPATQAKVAAIYPKNPEIRVKPRRKNYQVEMPPPLPPMEIDGEEAAARIKALVSYDARALNLKEEIHMALCDADVVAYGAVECGWDIFTKLEPNTSAVADGTAKATNVDLSKSKVELDESGDTHTQEMDLRYQEWIEKEQPWARFLPAEDLLFPPFANNIRDVPWMIVKKRRLAEEVKADRRFKLPSDFSECVSYLSKDDQEQSMTDIQGEGLEVGFCEEFHFWNKADRVYAVFIGGLQSPVLVMKWPYAASGFPVKVCYFYHNPRGGFPISPASLVMNQQNEKNLIRSRMSQHIDRWQSKVLVDAAVSDEEKQRFKVAPDGGLVEVEDIRKWLLINPAPMPAEWLAYDNATDKDIYNISGVNEYQRSGQGGAKFATEAILMAQNSAVKVDRQKDMARDFFLQIVNYLFELRQQLMTKKVEFSVTGEAGFTYHQVDPDQIRGEFEFEIDVEASAATDKQRDAEIGKMMLTIMPTVIPVVDPGAWVLQACKFLGIPESSKLVKPGEDMEAMRAAEYEDTLMNMGVAIHPNPKENLEAHLLVHTQDLTGIKQVIANGEINDPRRAQLIMQAIQLKEAHVAETAAMLDKTGRLKTEISGGGQPSGALRTDVKVNGAGQGKQPDGLSKGKQQANANREGTGTAQESKVNSATGGM